MQPSGSFFLSAILFVALLAINRNHWVARIREPHAHATAEEALLQQAASESSNDNGTWSCHLHKDNALESDTTADGAWIGGSTGTALNARSPTISTDGVARTSSGLPHRPPPQPAAAPPRHDDRECIPPSVGSLSLSQLLWWLAASMMGATLLWSLVRVAVRGFRLVFPDASITRYKACKMLMRDLQRQAADWSATRYTDQLFLHYHQGGSGGAGQGSTPDRRPVDPQELSRTASLPSSSSPTPIPDVNDTSDPSANSLPNAVAVAVCVSKFLNGRRSTRWMDAPPPPIELVQLLQTVAKAYSDYVHRDMAETFMHNVLKREELDPDCLYEFSMLDPSIQPDPEPGCEHLQPGLVAELVQDVSAVARSTLSGYAWLLELLGFAGLKLVLLPAFHLIGFVVRAALRVFGSS